MSRIRLLRKAVSLASATTIQGAHKRDSHLLQNNQISREIEEEEEEYGVTVTTPELPSFPNKYTIHIHDKVLRDQSGLDEQSS